MIVLQERNVSDYSLLVFNDIKHSFGFCDQIDELFFGKAVRTETGCLYSHNPVQVCPGCLPGYNLLFHLLEVFHIQHTPEMIQYPVIQVIAQYSVFDTVVDTRIIVDLDNHGAVVDHFYIDSV